jgi:SRSO17 transposase
MDAGVPFAWVAADSVYGVGSVETALRRAGKGYVLGVSATHTFGSCPGKPWVRRAAKEIALNIDPSAWQRLSAGEGTKGPRLYDWAYCQLADLDAKAYYEAPGGVWTRGLLIRRTLADGDMAFFSTWCPARTDIATLVAVEGRRWAIEDSFETTKNELGLDHNETRSWHGWHRHVSLVMLAFAMMTSIRHQANTIPPKKSATGPRGPRQARRIEPDSMVRPRNPAYCHEACAATHPASLHCRLVTLATRSSSRRSACP